MRTVIFKKCVIKRLTKAFALYIISNHVRQINNGSSPFLKARLKAFNLI
jgi:hypothetical protein